MSDRQRKIDEMQALVNRYQGVQPETASKPVAQPSESIWDTIKRTKSNLIDSPMENLRMKQQIQAKKWKKYHDEMTTILKD
jgi:hypothetical protein